MPGAGALAGQGAVETKTGYGDCAFFETGDQVAPLSCSSGRMRPLQGCLEEADLIVALRVF